MKKLMLSAIWLVAGMAASKAIAMEITSSAFTNGGSMGPQYTCNGKNISPPLQWSGFPAKTKSFVLIVEDPDAPQGVVDHWIVFNIPAAVSSLGENIKDYPKGALGGKNFKGDIGYMGPCPPDKEHRYFFTIYALDSELKLKAGARKVEVLEAMQKHILEAAALIGRYDQPSKKE